MIPTALQTRRGKQFITWIAMNDDDSIDAEVVACYMTVAMLAHVYNVKRIDLAREIVNIRIAERGSK